MSNALSRSPDRLQFSQRKKPGSSVPGPPRWETRIPLGSGGGAGLTDATSNWGDASGVCAIAAARRVRNARARIQVRRFGGGKVPPLVFRRRFFSVVDQQN